MFKNYFTTKRISVIGVMTALCVICNIFTIEIIPPYFVISLVMTMAFISGFLVGPIGAFIVCFMGDLIGCIIHPLGPYIPLVGLASGLAGLIFGFTAQLYGKFKNQKIAIFIILAIISYILVSIICTAGLNTLGLFLAYSKGKKTFWGYLSVRLPYQLIVSLINLVCSAFVYFVISKITYFSDILWDRYHTENEK